MHATEAAARAVVAGRPLDRRERVFYRCEGPAVNARPQRMPAGFRITAIHGHLPSVAVAEKLGFRKIESYSVFVGSFGMARASP